MVQYKSASCLDEYLLMMALNDVMHPWMIPSRFPNHSPGGYTLVPRAIVYEAYDQGYATYHVKEYTLENSSDTYRIPDGYEITERGMEYLENKYDDFRTALVALKL